MMNLRERYAPILMALQERIDAASKDYILTGSDTSLDEYNNLVFEMIEIKTTIKNSEKWKD